LIDALDDSSKNMVLRRWSMEALAKIGDPRAVQPIITVLNKTPKIYKGVIQAGRESIKKLTSSDKYKPYKIQQAKNFETSARYEDAAKIYEEIGMYNKAGRVRNLNQESTRDSKQFFAENMHIGDQTTIKDSVLNRSTIGKNKTSFNICPYCGKELNLIKKPKYCPFCTEQLG